VALRQFARLEVLKDELGSLLFHAVVGASRLPLTSVEAPLPAFSLGQLAYCYRSTADAGPPVATAITFLQGAFAENLGGLEKTKLLETLVRAGPAEEVKELAESFIAIWRHHGHEIRELPSLFRRVFNEVALSPYTDFVDKSLAFWRALLDGGHIDVEEYVDFLSYLLRQLGRHLTAYDLITFHHRGANYPDALLLDAVLRTYLDAMECHVDLFAPGTGDPPEQEKRKRLRRRALRQGWLLRRRCEGLPVPAAPTSPGENARILPPPYERVPEEQILKPETRPRRLYADDPWREPPGAQSRMLLHQSLLDLQHPDELRELGTAIFLDRPLGAAKAPGEPDRTPLLATEGFSRSIAEDRLRYLADDLGLLPRPELRAVLREKLREAPTGQQLPPGPRHGSSRPGSVSLEDARQVADDFVFVRTLPQGVRDFLSLFDFAPLTRQTALDYLDPSRRLLIFREGPEPRITLYDAAGQLRLQLQADLSEGYRVRAGMEYPAAGLRIVRVWGPSGTLPTALTIPARPV
jgi:hypothetical protein